MYFVYVLQNPKSAYYIGVSSDLERRIVEHNRGQNASTRGRGLWRIIYTEAYPSSLEAQRRESEIKRKKRKSYIEWLMKENPRGCVV